jgi:hydrogenase maturation protein HypF
MKEPFVEQILACGAELKSTFCLTRGIYAFPSHHIGDLENIETLSSFESGIEHFKRIFNIEPRLTVHDLHPEYLSTKYALSLKDMRKVGIQHHHAHIISCMGDNSIDGEVLGVSFDGTGYGTDGKIWGGEFLVCSDYSTYDRVAHLEYIPLPGGEKAIKEPWRIAAAVLYKIFGDDMFNLDIEFIREIDMSKWAIMKQMIEKKLNSPETSSAGRLFDAVSALIGVRKEIYYEAQAAIELQMKADEKDRGVYDFGQREQDGRTQILLEPLIKGIVSDLAKGITAEAISSRFHNTMAGIISDVCLKIKKQRGIDRVVLSGGVFQNALLMEAAYSRLNANAFTVYTHRRVPTNDGGISLGQALVANDLMRKGVV